MYTAKRLDLFLWDWNAGDVEIEAADALLLVLVGMGDAEEVDATDEFGALETARVGPDGVSFVFEWERCDAHCGHGAEVRIERLWCETEVFEGGDCVGRHGG